MSIYTVSVFILTYNQEEFIGQTLESILNQKTDFNFQLVIGEDCSSDDTWNICEKYAAENLNNVKLLPRLSVNIGLIANYMRTIKECDGKFIAICDGDDYWEDEMKLQKQVGFLEKNNEYSIVFTKVRKLFPDGSFKDSDADFLRDSTDFTDLIFDNFIPSVSVLFKNIQDNQNQLPNWILNYPYGDWPTYLWTIKNGGKIYFINESMSVYRIGIGISAQIRKINSDVLKVKLGILNQMIHDECFGNRKNKIIEAIHHKEIYLMTSYNREMKYFKAFLQYLYNLKVNKKKYKLTKLYFYSIFKSII